MSTRENQNNHTWAEVAQLYITDSHWSDLYYNNSLWTSLRKKNKTDLSIHNHNGIH